MAESVNGQQLAGVALAVSEAMAILQQAEPGVELDSANDWCEQVEIDDDEDGMTREILGAEYDDRFSTSQVDFDQWMQAHALLESEAHSRKPSPVPGSDACEQSDYDDDEDDDEQSEQDSGNAGDSDIRSAWANAQSSWRSDSELADDEPICIGSSDDEQDSSEYSSEQTVSRPYSDDEQSVSMSETADQQSAANAMLLFLSDSTSTAAAAATTQKTSGAGRPYERPPLPPLLASHASSSLVEMHNAINRSIERSLAIVDEITSDCERTEYSLEASECDFSGTEEGDVDMESEFCDQAGLASEQQRLSAQMASLNAELCQAECAKAELLGRVSVLEKDNREKTQQIEALRKTLDERTLADAQEISVLKDRIEGIAAKAADLSDKLDASTESLAEAKQALKIADCERQDLVSRCSGLGESIELLDARLANEMEAHRVTQNDLRLARDGNASESRRLELESINARLGQKCAEQKTQLTLAHDKERLLLNTNRALEARLRDALCKESQPAMPEDALADYRRAWDQQLVETRAAAKLAGERLAVSERALLEERRVNEQLRKRLDEMEASQRTLEQSARKRKLQEIASAGEGASENRWTIGDGSPTMAAKANMLATPTRPGTTEGKRRLLQASSGRFQQAVVDAGEFARERRRHRIGSPLAERLPVTPRVNLQAHHVDVASLISPLRKSAR